MKRLLNIKKKKKVKVNDDPFLATDVVDTIGQQQQQQQNSNNNNSQQQQQQSSTSTVGTPTGYAYARSVYVSDTINPTTSNEDGFGSGSGGTLRSRSGRMRGSAGLRNHSTLIPVIYEQDAGNGGNVDNEVYELLTTGGGGGRNRNTNTSLEEGKRWSRIPEQTRNSKEVVQQQQVNPNNISDFNTTGTLPNENNSQDSDGACTSGEGLFGLCTADDGDNNTSSTTTNSVTQQSQHLQQQRSISCQNNNNVKQQPHDMKKESINIILQPDAIYEEHYGDAYIDSLIKYLYPSGYQSMRPRSGPWKLSIFIFCLFTWLSIFIVGHCYERGQQYYNDGTNGAYYETGGVDDAYLQEVDDDMIVMETRWCGSKLLYFMWIVSVWITVLSMSYCSIIGYVKVRDIAVANGRSQPPGMLSLGRSNVGDGSGSGSNNGTMNIGGSVGRSDYYAMLDNVSGMMTHGTSSLRNTVGSNGGGSDAGASSTGNGEEGGYSSYQDGEVTRRYAPSIYQSDGTPQFWGGHIYRPTQAAVAMTNRP